MMSCDVIILISGCVLIDAAGDSVGVTIYNVSSSCSFSTGDILTVSNPTLTHTHLEELVSSGLF